MKKMVSHREQLVVVLWPLVRAICEPAPPPPWLAGCSVVAREKLAVAPLSSFTAATLS